MDEVWGYETEADPHTCLLYTSSQRIVTDDVLTIVDSYFMPYGIECDQYNVLGEILDIKMCIRDRTSTANIK